MFNIMPGEHAWMSRDPFMRGAGGFQIPGMGTMRTPGDGGIFSTPQITGGIMGDEGSPKRDQMMAFAAQLLAGSGSSPVRRTFGELVGEAMLAGQQARAVSQDRQGEREDRKAMREYRAAQAEALNRPDPVTPPNSVKEYEFAKSQGFKGSFQEWMAAGGGAASETADIQNWRHYKGLPPDQQKEWMSLLRQPTAPQLSVINGVPTLVDRLNATTTPLTTQQAEIEAAVAKAVAEAKAKATGEGEGAIEKRAIGAGNVLDLVKEARPLVEIGTGSAVGAGADKVAGWFGASTDGATALARLKVLQANLMLSMPRMEGPQSDRDVDLYREAAASLGDPTVPSDQKGAALDQIEKLQTKYQEAGGRAPAAPGAAPGGKKRIKVDAQGNVIGN
jgi:hypothetical protein